MLLTDNIAKTTVKAEFIEEDKGEEENYLNIPSTSSCSDEISDFQTSDPSNSIMNFDTTSSEFEIEYFVGDIVWVNVKGHPLWPGMIIYPKNETIFTKFKCKSSSKLSVQFHIQFFCNNYRTMWVFSTAIFPYEGLNHLAPYMEKRKSILNTSRTFVTYAEQNMLKSFSKMDPFLTFQARNRKAAQWYQAVEEADIFIAFARYERIQLFKVLLIKDKEKRKIQENYEERDRKPDVKAKIFTGCSPDQLVLFQQLEASEFPKVVLRLFNSKVKKIFEVSNKNGNCKSNEQEKNIKNNEANNNCGQFSEDVQNIHENHGDAKNIEEKFKESNYPNFKARYFKGHSPDELVILQPFEMSKFPRVVLQRLNLKFLKISEVTDKNSNCNLNELIKEKEIKNHESKNIPDQFNEDVKYIHGKAGEDVKNIEGRDREQSDMAQYFKDYSPVELVPLQKLDAPESSKDFLRRLDANDKKESFHVAGSNMEDEDEISSVTPSDSLNSTKKSKPFKYFKNYLESDGKGSLQHQRKHCSGYKCAYCEFSCRFQSSMYRHYLIHSKTKLFKCAVCDYTTNYKSNLNVHLRIHSNLKLFKCAECNQKGKLKLYSLKHKCPECKFESNVNNSTQKHLNNDHREFSCIEKVAVPKALTHSTATLFRCFACDYTTKFKWILKEHLYTHSNSKRFKCSECSYECNQKGSLRLHFLKHTNQKLYKCSVCDYKCNLKSSLKRHLLTHAEKKLLKCAECDYETNYKANLKIHILTHSKTKLLKCSECDYECNHKRSLIKHIKEAHSLFKCSECDYECTQKSNLIQHIKETHSIMKFFECLECNYKSIYKGNFKSHLLTHSNSYLFECSECPYKSNYKSNLKHHLVKHNSKKEKFRRCGLQS